MNQVLSSLGLGLEPWPLPQHQDLDLKMVSGALETQDLGVKISKLDVNVDVNRLLLQYVAYAELRVDGT